MKPTRHALALGMGTSLLALGVASGPSLASDTVTWRWTASVSDSVLRSVNIDSDLAPTGLVQIENLQVQIGDVTAVSRVTGIHNNKPGMTIMETDTETVSTFGFVDVDFKAALQIGAGNNDGANPAGAARYDFSGFFDDPALPGAQSHLALHTLANNLDTIDHEKSFVNEDTETFEIYAYFDDLDMFLEVKGSYANCTPGGASCTPTGTVELFRLDGEEKTFVALSALEQQNGVDQVNTAGSGNVKLSADFTAAQEWREILTEIVTYREVVLPVVLDAMTDLPTVVSTAIAVANNSSITSDVAIQLHGRQLAWGGFTDENSQPGSSDIAALQLFAPIQQGEVSALSEVTDILNASVDSNATAVVNNKDVVLASALPDNHLLIGDILQFSANSVEARSAVSAVDLQSYVNLALIQRPVVASTATAVGNNLAITVQALPVLVP